mmetsp:Transcript_12398/g.17035  ORF Transcript_12398/g.17035 Transcript_12398/m.17035 type:complete len:239 (-) Transcript_12398:486-1202(-)
MPVWNDGVPFLDRIFHDYWLDDSIINVFLKKALFYFREDRAVLMDSHFYNIFYDDSHQEENVVPNYDKVKAWTSKQYKDDKSLFDEDVVLHIPCNYPAGSHWIHTYINMKYKTINIIDPKHTEEYEKHLGQVLLIYLQMEHLQKLGTELNVEEWTIKRNLATPKQTDGHSCGVFLILNAIRIFEKQHELTLTDTYSWDALLTTATLKNVRRLLKEIIVGNKYFVDILEYVKDHISRKL